VDFALNDTQRTIAAVAAETLAREPAEAAWKALGRAGLLALGVPARLGGEGLGVVEIAVLLTEVGRAAVPLPALQTLALGVLPIAVLGTERQQGELLSGVGLGYRLLTAALREPADAPTTVDVGVVSGVKVGVGYAATAHRILVPAGGEVFLVDPQAPGVSLTPTSTSSGTPEYTVRFDGVRADRLGGPGAARELERLAIAGACAIGDGLLAGALDLTATHVRTREQFGKPLATFQAVAHQIADVYTGARTLHLATVAACWRLGEHHAVIHRRLGHPQPRSTSFPASSPPAKLPPDPPPTPHPIWGGGYANKGGGHPDRGGSYPNKGELATGAPASGDAGLAGEPFNPTGEAAEGGFHEVGPGEGHLQQPQHGMDGGGLAGGGLDGDRLDSAADVGADLDLGVAAYWVAEEVPRALQVCHHLHGGLGVDVSYPLHRYYSAAKDLVRFLGGIEHCLERLCASS
jgi:3-oxo-4-pregnene-20-carboxyl-CoA dehydrogenase alpha subunit